MQEELIGVCVGASAILGAAVSQDAKDVYTMLIIEGQDFIVQEVGSSKGGPVRIDLGEADVGVGVYARLLVEPPYALYVADIAGVLGNKEAG